MISPQISGFSCQYQSTNAPYLFIHQPHTLYNVYLQVLLISPVNTISPKPLTHSFNNHTHHKIILSQYICFPLSVPFHKPSKIFIHLTPIFYNVSLPTLLFSPLSTTPRTNQTYSITYHPHYKIFLSQYFRLTLSVPIHQCYIQPKFHTVSFTYNPRCIIFLYKTSVFHCQYHSTNAPNTFIHLQQILYNFSLPVLQISLSVQFHQRSVHIHSTTTYDV